MQRSLNQEVVRSAPGMLHHPVRIDYAAASEMGDAHAENEDQYLVGFVRPAFEVAQTSARGLRDGRDERRAMILAVADGVGSDGLGAVASREAILSLSAALERHRPASLPPMRRRLGSLPEVRAELVGFFALSHERIQALARRERRPSSMASTLTIAYLRYPHLYVAHVGDSRCQLLRRGHLHALTQDHTIAEQLREQDIEVDEGSLFEHMLTHALGGGNVSIHRPDVGRWTLEPGDALVLCSDGVSDILEDEEIAEVLSDMETAEEGARELVARAAEWDGRDDMTAVVARIESVPPTKPC